MYRNKAFLEGTSVCILYHVYVCTYVQVCNVMYVSHHVYRTRGIIYFLRGSISLLLF